MRPGLFHVIILAAIQAPPAVIKKPTQNATTNSALLLSRRKAAPKNAATVPTIPKMTANTIISQLTAAWMIRRTDGPFLKGEECARGLELPFMRDLLC
jgi:hypothetical protein